MIKYLLNLFILVCMSSFSLYNCNASHGGERKDDTKQPSTDSLQKGLSKVYLIKEINPQNLVKIYEALRRQGKWQSK